MPSKLRHQSSYPWRQQSLIACCSLVLMTFGSCFSAHAQEQSRQVLILFPDNDANRAALTGSEVVSRRLSARSLATIETRGHFRDLSRFPDVAHKRVVHIPGQRYTQATPDLVRDARAPERWQLSAKNPPVETVSLFRQAILPGRHPALALAATGAVALLIAALGVLLIRIRKFRRAETRLRQTEERLGSAAASAGMGLWHYDIEANHLWCSEHCAAMFGLAPGRPLTTEAILQMVHPEDQQVAVASIRAATCGMLTDGVGEFRIVRPDGQVHWIQARGRASFDARLRPVTVTGIFSDVTGHKAARVETARLSQRILEIQEEERQRIAQELHDSTAQHLAAIGLNLMAVRGSNSPRQRAKIFDDLESSLEEAAKELRTFTYLLYPPALATDGLDRTLRRYIEGFARRTGLYVTLRSSGAIDELSEALQQAILRIVQEALANVHRHASASRAAVSLRRVADRLHLVISDDGNRPIAGECRKDRKAGPLPQGVGIAGMTARVKHFGGELDVRRRSAGMTVHAVVPLGERRITPDMWEARRMANGEQTARKHSHDGTGPKGSPWTRARTSISGHRS
jgi:PAS domain S-box-containing protein